MPDVDNVIDQLEISGLLSDEGMSMVIFDLVVKIWAPQNII